MQQARQCGLTNHQLRSACWSRLHRGIYIDAEIAAQHQHDEHALRANAATAFIPPHAVIAGLSAAWLYGIRLLPPDDPVEVAVPHDGWFGPVSGLRIRRANFEPSDIIWEHPRRTTPLRTAWDIACRIETPNAVAALDAFLASRLVTPAALHALADQPGRWRRHRARRIIDMADALAESPQESRLRALLIEAGLPRPVCQWVIDQDVSDGKKSIARVDLAWPEQRVAVEYDGYWHAAPEQLRQDRARLNRILTAGWLVIHVTNDRLRRDVPGLVAEIRQAIRIQQL